jgi:hypothetical protein
MTGDLPGDEKLFFCARQLQILSNRMIVGNVAYLINVFPFFLKPTLKSQFILPQGSQRIWQYDFLQVRPEVQSQYQRTNQ